MIKLPGDRDMETLLRRVKEALDHVADRNRGKEISNRDWFPVIASEIAKRVKIEVPGLKCYARGKERGTAADSCDGTEWNNLDFLALLNDDDDSEFPAQAVVVGEVEWSDSYDEIDYDFEKLLIVDSLMFFMVFLQFAENDAHDKLGQLEAVAKRRQAYALKRGMARPPAFLLSCYVADPPKKRFIHKSSLAL